MVWVSHPPAFLDVSRHFVKKKTPRNPSRSEFRCMGELIYQKTPLSSTYHWFEAHWKFRITVRGVAAAVSLFGDDFYCICFDHPNRETAMLSSTWLLFIFLNDIGQVPPPSVSWGTWLDAVTVVVEDVWWLWQWWWQQQWWIIKRTMASPHPLPSQHQAVAGVSGRQPASVVIVIVFVMMMLLTIICMMVLMREQVWVLE